MRIPHDVVRLFLRHPEGDARLKQVEPYQVCLGLQTPTMIAMPSNVVAVTTLHITTREAGSSILIMHSILLVVDSNYWTSHSSAEGHLTSTSTSLAFGFLGKRAECCGLWEMVAISKAAGAAPARVDARNHNTKSRATYYHHY